MKLLVAFSLATIFACSINEPGPSGFPCKNPQPVVEGTESGYEACDGFEHRKSIVDCPTSVPRSEGLCSGGGGCSMDSDCARMPLGYCKVLEVGCVCASGCVKDSDCASGQICECGDPIGWCVDAACKSDGECNGGLCASTTAGSPSCGRSTFACTTPDDECGSYLDCPDGQGCALVGGQRECAAFDYHCGG